MAETRSPPHYKTCCNQLGPPSLPHWVEGGGQKHLRTVQIPFLHSGSFLSGSSSCRRWVGQVCSSEADSLYSDRRNVWACQQLQQSSSLASLNRRNIFWFAWEFICLHYLRWSWLSSARPQSSSAIFRTLQLWSEHHPSQREAQL